MLPRSKNNIPSPTDSNAKIEVVVKTVFLHVFSFKFELEFKSL